MLMKQSNYILFISKKYLVIGKKGNHLTICNDDYYNLGENAVTIKREEVTFL